MAGPIRPCWALVCAAILCAPAAQAHSNTLSIVLNTNAWSIGTVPVSGKADTWLERRGAFCVSNNGAMPVSLYIAVTNSAPSGWKPAASPAWNQFRMGWSQASGRGFPQYDPVLYSPSVMTQGLATNQAFRFDLEFRAPTGTGQPGIQQQIRPAVIAVGE
jgi:hypothetical protein